MDRNSTKFKELLWFKLPTCLGDLAIYYLLLWMLASRENMFILVLVCFAVAFALVPLKLNERRMTLGKVIYRAICQVVITVVLFYLTSFFLVDRFESGFYILFFLCSLFGVTLWHCLIKIMIGMLRKKGRNSKHVLFVGADKNAVSLYKSIKSGYGVDGYNIHGFFSDYSAESLPSGAVMLGKLSGVFEYLATQNIDEVYCSVNPAISTDFVNSVIRLCDKHFIAFYYVPNMEGYAHRKHIFEEFGTVNVLRLRDEPLMDPINRFWKRTFDIVVSGLFLITVFPFAFLFAAVGIKMSSPGPIFFRQARTGYRGNSFGCLKFRTMHVNADSDKVQATADDPRKFKFGDLLRRTSIDELPQFINIFMGDMSLIGPRPHMEYHTEMYSKLIDEYLVRHLCKPGLSGWAQVNGCRGETKTVDQMKERVEHDVWYLEHWTFWLDIKIIFMTIMQVLKGDEQAY